MLLSVNYMEGKRILLVEDDPLLQKLYQDILKDEKINVDSAVDGETAFAKMKKGGYDLILLDIMIPKMTGIEVMKKLQTDKPDKINKKIVFLTNMDKGNDIDEVKKMGTEYLIKSNFNPEEFIQKVNSYL